ncbi:hypothetical protein [uncultured Polaribacter sp.]|uniref:hypothetical protein n=1 Tax=uncultured Polaribacter sp. TaxID=174711 RepID=UPI00260DB3DB|nr:hypothetical protein [uncultured Polaribacter sp.]
MKNKLLHYLRTGILFLGILITVSSCEKEELITQNYQEESNFSKISFSELPSEFLPEVKELKTNYYSKSKQDDNLLIYDKQQVIKLVDSIKNTRYSVKFNIQNQPYNVLYNLILGKDVYGKKQEPFIIKYTINNFNEVYLNGKYDFSKMKGSIAIHKYYPFLSYLDNLKKTAHNKTEDGLIEDDPCSEYNNDGSSVGSSGRGSSSVSDPLEAEENQVQFEEPPGGVATSDGDATCNINLWYSSNTDLDNLFAITWSCTDGTKGNLDVKKSGKTDSLDCIKEGDVPVNEGEEEMFEIDIENTEKIDPKEELKCFDATKNAKLTIYVQQPLENSNEVYTGSNGPGHAFIGIEQNNITRNLGFYPVKEANRALIGVGKTYDSEIRSNNDYMYHISISKNITNTQLQTIMEYIRNAPNKYNVNSFACADFAIAIGNLAGLGLPSTTVNKYLFNGRSPGTLGQEIRQINSNNEVTVSKIKANSPNKTGECK